MAAAAAASSPFSLRYICVSCKLNIFRRGWFDDRTIFVVDIVVVETEDILCNTTWRPKTISLLVLMLVVLTWNTGDDLCSKPYALHFCLRRVGYRQTMETETGSGSNYFIMRTEKPQEYTHSVVTWLSRLQEKSCHVSDCLFSLLVSTTTGYLVFHFSFFPLHIITSHNVSPFEK